jgi:phosphoribosyl 1,2-cyclic phosphodiesterase
MRVRFRGVRGSVPWSVPEAIVHGCNTPCIEIFDERTGGILVLDAGSGIVGVNPSSMASSAIERPVALLLTHYHWDHLLGLPFFMTLYQPGWDLTIQAPILESHDPSWLDTMFKSPFFPVPYQHLPNKPRVQTVEPGKVDITGFEVTSLELNHPGGALAYRIKGATGDFVYATDHEFGDPAFDRPLGDFAKGAAVMVLDAHFTPEELPQHRGWGHSDWRQCAEFAAANGAGSLYLFHHKPGRSDAALEQIREEARKIFKATDTASEEAAIVV